MDSVSYTKAKASFGAVLDKVVADRAPVAITRRTGEAVVIIAESDWAAIQKTIEMGR
jgi:antitoxin YefM